MLILINSNKVSIFEVKTIEINAIINHMYNYCINRNKNLKIFKH